MRRRGLQGSTSLISPEDDARLNAMARLGRLIETCEAGRPDLYWYTSAVEELRGVPGLRAEFSPILRRARELAQGVWNAHPNHPTNRRTR